ncbi:MAG: hypothetical protein ABIO72_03915 [Patescibacteria group bacterium]
MAAPSLTALLKKLDALREKEDYKSIGQLICGQIVVAKDGKSIEALEGAEAVEDMFLGEDDAGPEVGAALLKRAFAVGGAGGASLLRMLNVIALYDHAEPLCATPPKTSHRKAQVLSVVEKSLEMLRAGAADKNAAFRASSLYLLLTCKNTGAEDAICALQCLLKEKDATVRLTALLALGVIGKRLPAKDNTRLECVKVVEEEAKKKYPATVAVLAAACAANASSMLGLAWSSTLVKSVNASFKKPALLPAAWGYHKGANTMQVVMPALSVQSGATLEPLIAGIAKIGSDSIPLLYGLAFGNTDALVGDGVGIVLDELTPVQKQVLTAFASPSLVSSYALRDQLNVFSFEAVKGAIEAKEPMWKPITVQTKKGSRDLAPAIIWRLVARGDIAVADAMKALTKALPATDLAGIVLYGPDAIRPFNSSSWNAEGKKRNMDLTGEVVAWLEKNDAGWQKRVRAAVTSNERKIDYVIGYALLRLVKQKKETLQEEDKKIIQMTMLTAMDKPHLLVEYTGVVPAFIRDYMIEGAVPSSLNDIKKFLAAHPYKA